MLRKLPSALIAVRSCELTAEREIFDRPCSHLQCEYGYETARGHTCAVSLQRRAGKGSRPDFRWLLDTGPLGALIALSAGGAGCLLARSAADYAADRPQEQAAFRERG
jgi:hypothetical protein